MPTNRKGHTMNGTPATIGADFATELAAAAGDHHEVVAVIDAYAQALTNEDFGMAAVSALGVLTHILGALRPYIPQDNYDLYERLGIAAQDRRTTTGAAL